LRTYNDPKNKEFLDAINKGYVPREIAQGAREVMVNLVDHKTEDYTPPPKVFKAFEGSGRTLGSQRPTQTYL
jgi:UBX domain-containing protein 1